jgi:hypothetical protein
VDESKFQEQKASKTAEAQIKSIFTKKKKDKPAGSDLGRPSQSQYQLRVHLYQGRCLPAADATGLSDPYVVVKCCGKVILYHSTSPVCIAYQ